MRAMPWPWRCATRNSRRLRLLVSRLIGFLHGRIAAKTAPAVTLDVGGVGYELEAPMSTFLNLPARR